MRIIQINCVYNYGSTGKIVKDIHEGLLEKGLNSQVIYGRGKNSNDFGVYKIGNEFYSKFNKLCSSISGLAYGGCFLSTKQIEAFINQNMPDIVHLHCINGNFVNIYKLVSWLNKRKIRTVLTLHAEFMYTGNCSYAFDCNKWVKGCDKCKVFHSSSNSLFFDRTAKSWNLMYEAFKGFSHIVVVSVSPWLESRAKKSKILRDLTHITILNGINNNVFKFYKSEFRDESVILHVTANFDPTTDNIKGGKFIVQLAERLREKALNVKILVVANVYKNVTLPENILLIGKVSSQLELAKLYSRAKVTVLTSQKETFSMICAESLSCGTPIVGFKAGAPEVISLPEYSSFVEYGDLENLELKLIDFLYKNIDKESLSFIAGNYYSKERMIQEYIKIYNKSLNI